MTKYVWRFSDHGLGGSMYCYVGNELMAEAHGSGGQYSVKVHRRNFPGGESDFVHKEEVFDPQDHIMPIVEQFLDTGFWNPRVKVLQNGQWVGGDLESIAQNTQMQRHANDVVGDFIGEE